MADILIIASPGMANGFVMSSRWKLDWFGRSHKPRLLPGSALQSRIRASVSDPEEQTSISKNDKEIKGWNGQSLAKMAVVAFAAGVLVIGSAGDAMATRSGGRVGGQAFRSSPPPKSAPRINKSRTNVFINPPVAPPIFGGYGFGTPFFGGWGWSPFSFVPGPSVAIVGVGFDFFGLLLVLGLVGSIVRNFSRRNDDEDDFYDQ